jgi:3-methyladenine DNA glycosylase AlkD
MSSKKMTLSQAMKYLEQHGDEKVRLRYVRDGAGDNVFGVLLGTIRGLARTLGTDHELGLQLWGTGNHEARILACMVLDPEALTVKEARGLLEPLASPALVDELTERLLVHTPIAAALQVRWMDGSDELPRRAGWKILAGRIKILAGRITRGLVKDLDVGAILARIERELPLAPYRAKEGMNYCLCWIGIHLPAYRSEALAVGERLGRWDPRPVPKGCTSSYPPEFIPAWLALCKGEKTDARKAIETAARAKRSRANASAPTDRSARKIRPTAGGTRRRDRQA